VVLSLTTDFPPDDPAHIAERRGDTMTVDDRTRLNLHRKLEAVLGAEEADTLMAHLPPTTWRDIATKDDLQVLGADIRTEIADLRTELRTEISRSIDRQTRWMVTFICAWSTIVLGAARLLF